MSSLIERKIQIDRHEIIVHVPAREEDYLELAARGESVDPYWGKIWDAALGSAECILNRQWPAGATAIELGCGIGLAGIAGLKAGLQVVFTDHEPLAVALAIENAQRNGFADSSGHVLDWAGDGTDGTTENKFDFCLASDVLYESDSHADLLAMAAQLLHSGGLFFIGDPGRRNTRDFLTLATKRKWKVRLFDQNQNETAVPSTNEFQWIELKRI